MQYLVKEKRAVYAQQTPLAIAKEVQGLRALFDEVEFIECAVCINHSLSDNTLLAL